MSPWIKEIPNEYFASYVNIIIWVKSVGFFPIWPVPAPFPKQGEKTLINVYHIKTMCRVQESRPYLKGQGHTSILNLTLSQLEFIGTHILSGL
jgi:hypothetical protein